MIQDILIFVAGLFVGGSLGVFIMALLIAGKQSDVESERIMSYKDGYQKGFDDGYELQKSHTK